MALLAEVQVSLFVAGAALGEVQVSLFVAGAALGKVQVPLFAAGAALGEVQVSLFVAGAAFGEVQVSLFVAGAVFGEVEVSLFVAGAVFGEIWNYSRSAKCCIFQYKMRVVGVKSNLGCEAGCGVTVSFWRHYHDHLSRQHAIPIICVCNMSKTKSLQCLPAMYVYFFSPLPRAPLQLWRS